MRIRLWTSIAACFALAFSFSAGAQQADSIKVGVLYSLAGPTASAEAPLQDAVLLAVEEINAKGGVLGRPIAPVMANPGSDWLRRTPQMAEQLLTRDRVAAIFGCGSEATRRMVIEVVEKHNGLLFYSMPPEGEEQSENIFYMSALPNQRVVPAVEYMRSPEGGSRKKFFLLGTDSMWYLNKTLKRYLLSKNVPEGNIREEYTSFGHRTYSVIVDKIKEFGREGDAVVFSTITTEESNAAFYEEFFAVGLQPAAIPVVSFSLSEDDLRTAPPSVAGHLVAQSYFQSIDTPENRKFTEAFKRKYGASRTTGAAIEAAYSGVYLWKAAVEKAGSFDADKIRSAAFGLEYDTPGGRSRMHSQNHYSFHPLYIARIRTDRQLDIIFKSVGVAPEPYPR